ncbi:unnamed protein product [Peniophora sp. CBMAI 1063]|nr:unnamed protein product [Peniophora sp. CBMAI 1063]
MAPSVHLEEGSDSEDDPDYVPEQDTGSPTTPDGERNTKRRRVEEPDSELSAQDEEARKQARDKAWAELQASLSSNGKSEVKKMVKIRKTHRFAGEDVMEVVEVPEDSDDAKKWPLWESSADLSPVKSPVPSTPSHTADVEASSSSTLIPVPVAPVKKPGRRKSRVQLSDIPSASSQKAKKLSTIEKSAIDWKAHSRDDAQLMDELDANRRGGGYLEKVQFLNDVGDRRDKLLEESKDKKRRRG